MWTHAWLAAEVRLEVQLDNVDPALRGFKTPYVRTAIGPSVFTTLHVA